MVRNRNALEVGSSRERAAVSNRIAYGRGRDSAPSAALSEQQEQHRAALKTLGLEGDKKAQISFDEIKRRYKELARHWHPDRHIRPAEKAAAEQALAAEKAKVASLEAKVQELERRVAASPTPASTSPGGPSAKEKELEAEVARLKGELAKAPQSAACTVL